MRHDRNHHLPIWNRAGHASLALVGVAVGLLVLRVTTGTHANALVRLDNVTVAMAALVALVGWVVVRYSAVYLAGDPNQARYVRRLLATLASVWLVVLANHLVLLVAAWSATSLALHGLLVHQRERSVAVSVAHKKFLLARGADLCMIGAVIAFAVAYDTLRIDRITAAAGSGSLPTAALIGIILVAIAALLKCAQLPFHGWLIQVMEAPTPVSALLHAGVVNLGGFVLLRFAPVVDASVSTRALLTIAGAGTAVVAGLVMTTRVSVKVALAWSTCAQMGFMLVQCGLGLWEMALLHLLAHSVYKAHAFLGAGGTVRLTQRRRLAPRASVPGPTDWLRRLFVAAAITVGVGLVWNALPSVAPLSGTVWVFMGIVVGGLVPLAAPGSRLSMMRVVAVAVAYVVLHDLASRMVPKGASAPAWLLVFTAVAFAGLFAMQAVVLSAPTIGIARRLRPWLYAGFFLDEAFTRVAFAVSAPPAPGATTSPLPQITASPVIPGTPSDRRVIEEPIHCKPEPQEIPA